MRLTDVEAIRMSLARIAADLALIDARLARLSAANAALPARSYAVAGGDLMRIEQVAERTAVAVSTLRRWRQAKTGPKSTRIGRQVVYRAPTSRPGSSNSYLGRERGALSPRGTEASPTPQLYAAPRLPVT
ncbi:helix-turn-helix transcriptional regulator [Nocardioides sp. CPCC 206347]|uniref:helix-turn-helix transcriptional regulator n=1 Tax=unclassified Nocardioides TaxID=2615069 RepID=UPI00366C6855